MPDALLLMDLPLDVIVEATGVPEAGARHAREAIRCGKHVAMVNKEADVTVGPILKALADGAGVVYTAVDGDQHGLLMRPARAVADGVPLPLHMATGNALAVDVPAGDVITAEQIVRPPDSALWALRAEQDGRFLGR